MIKANFNTYASYVTDSLYQWDLNQILNVSGLNLSVAPEVHFSNANMDKAIVRQATMTDHVVNVKIPNSLLQDPLTIYAHIGIYEGGTFKVVEKVEIPVIPKDRPIDYQIQDSDEEIYSFNQVLNALGNKADNARIDNIIAHNNDTEGNTELIDARLGYNAIKYDTVGEAIRKQIKVLSDRISVEVGKNLYNLADDESGYLSTNGDIVKDPSLDWITTGFIDVRGCTDIVCSHDLNGDGYRDFYSFLFMCTYTNDKTFIEQVYTTAPYTTTIPDGVGYIRFCYHANEVHDLQVEKGTQKTAYETYRERYKLADTKAYIESYSGKKWVCIGDSLTENNFRTTKNYHEYVAEKTGIIVDNKGMSGSGYKRSEDNGKAFYQTARYIPTDADVVTIFGSGNDLAHIDALGTITDTGTATICGCINMTINNIIAVKPDVSLGIISPTPWVNYPPSVSNNDMARYTDALRQICEYRSIPFLDLYHSSNLRPWTEEGRNACYSRDDGNGVHPDETGHKLIAARFKTFIDSLII